MKRWLIRTLILIVCLAVLWLAAGLAAKSLVSGASSSGFVASLESTVGAPVSVGAGSFDLAQWFLLHPAVSFQNIAIGNPPGFRGKNLIEARSLAAQVSLLPLFHKTLAVHSVTLDSPRILIETNAQGESNIEALLRHSQKGAAPSGHAAARTRPATSPGASNTSSVPAGSDLVVDQLAITNGELVAENVAISGINIHLTDLALDRPCRLDFAARLFNGRNSMLHLEAQAGPFASDSLPLNGTASITIAPADMPPAFRRKQFGTLLLAPGDKARATFTASVKGDIYRTISGPAKLAISDFQIGKDEKHVLPLSGDAPLEFNASRLMSSPAVELRMASAKIRVGKGQWTGSAQLDLHGSMASGRSTGKIGNVDINEILSSLTSSEGKIYGQLEMPYSLDFSGKNADEIRNSLHGMGKLSITQGRIAALDLLATIQQVALHPEQALEGKRGGTPFTSLSSDLTVAQQKMNIGAFDLESPALRVTGQGVVDFDHNLNFDLVAHTSGDLAQLVSRISGPAQGGGLPLSITGTVDAPKVRPKMGKVISNVAGGLLDSLLKKKK